MQATNVGLRFPDKALPFDDWQQIRSRLAGMANSTAWYLGDWLVYGESQHADRYRQAVEAVGPNYQTLRNYAWITRQFSLS